MKKSILYALALVLICVFQSCTKKTAEDAIIVSNTIVFGQVDGMKINKYETNNFGLISLDLNGDGLKDLVSNTEYVGSANLGHDFVTTLKCNHNNILLLGDVIQQERFLHVDSTFYLENNTIWIEWTYTCQQSFETDFLISITEKLSNIDHDSGDSYGTDNSFMSTEVCLKNWSYQTSLFDSIDGVNYYYWYTTLNDCDYFPKEEEKYIGFKIKDNNKERLGWIKFVLHNDGIELLETAIQQ